MIAQCRSCKAPILWLRSATSGKPMPVDAEPSPEGTILRTGPNGELARVIRAGDAVDSSQPRYTTHWATCPHADQHRKENARMTDTHESTTGYDPAADVTKLRGRGGEQEYLEVKYRLKWLRDRHPHARLRTEHVEITDKRAVFRATITLPEGGESSGYGSESPQDFTDYIEKAETKAIGRALAALGFGTQFVESELDGKRGPRVVDAPMPARQTRSEGLGRAENGHKAKLDGQGDNAAQRPPQRAAGVSEGRPITDKQIRFIEAIAREKGIADDELHGYVRRTFGADHYTAITSRDASALIDWLQGRRVDIDSVDQEAYSQPDAAPPADTDQRKRAWKHRIAETIADGSDEAWERLFDNADSPGKWVMLATHAPDLDTLRLIGVASVDRGRFDTHLDRAIAAREAELKQAG